MTQKELLAFTKEATKGIKTEKYLSDLSRMLKKVTVEAAFGSDLDVGYIFKQLPTIRFFIR